MGKLWDFLMRRKSLCLAVLAVFGASFILSQQFLAEQLVSTQAPTEPDINISQSPVDIPSAPEITDLPTIDDLGSVSEVKPSDDPGSDVSDDSPDGSPDDLPFEFNEPTHTENYFTIVTGPRDVAMLNLVEVPRTGGEAPAFGIATGDDGYGVGSNLPSDMASDTDHVSSAISAATLVGIQSGSKRFGFWSGFSATFLVLLTVISLVYLSVRFSR